MQFQMGEIHVNRGNAELILRAKIPRNMDYLDWYCSMLGRVLDRETVEVEGSLTTWGKKIAARKRAFRKQNSHRAASAEKKVRAPGLGIL